jgi:hypothetical protein
MRTGIVGDQSRYPSAKYNQISGVPESTYPHVQPPPMAAASPQWRRVRSNRRLAPNRR